MRERERERERERRGNILQCIAVPVVSSHLEHAERKPCWEEGRREVSRMMLPNDMSCD